MNKKKFISEIVKETGLLPADVRVAVDLVFDAVRRKILEGHEVRIGDVGRFAFKYLEAKHGVNNLTGEEIDVEARVKLRFKPFPLMRADIRNKLSPALVSQMQDLSSDDDEE